MSELKGSVICDTLITQHKNISRKRYGLRTVPFFIPVSVLYPWGLTSVMRVKYIIITIKQTSPGKCSHLPRDVHLDLKNIYRKVKVSPSFTIHIMVLPVLSMISLPYSS